MIVDGKKRCSKCCEWKVINAFYSSVNTVDGLRSECKKCTKISQRIHYKNNRLKRRNYLIANKERIAAYQKTYRVNHKEELRVYYKAWWIANRKRELNSE